MRAISSTAPSAKPSCPNTSNAASRIATPLSTLDLACTDIATAYQRVAHLEPVRIVVLMSSKSQTVSSTSHAAHPLTVGRASLVLIPGGLLALLSTTIVGVTTPDIIAELGTGISSAQWITTIYLLTAGLGIAVSGWASARYGVKPVWLISMSLYTGGALGSASAPEISTLVAARARSEERRVGKECRARRLSEDSKNKY